MPLISNPAEAAGEKVFLFSDNKLLAYTDNVSVLPDAEVLKHFLPTPMRLLT